MLGGGQWAPEETRELISIRGELEKDFTAAKHNKTLWEIVSATMKDRGYTRTPDQCKSKWKNLLNRYKGKETSDPENGSQFPFFEELHAVFNERAKSMQRRLLESEAGSGSTQAKKRIKRTTVDRSSDEFSEEGEDEDGSEEERPTRGISRKRKKADKIVPNPGTSTNTGLQEVLGEFFLQQQKMEMQWREMMDRHADERCLFEQEWQQSMEKLERERLMVEKAWREREEEKRRRDENRAERRDSLLTTLLNKLINGVLLRAVLGHKKYITPNKRHMLPYFLNSSMPEAEFNSMIKELHHESLGQPELRSSKAGRDVTKYPIPECMCNNVETNSI